MTASSKKTEKYGGFEQGPIRPPSEADSLLIRITRNCPWNRCTFCPVYKGEPFSLRPADHVILDIDAVSRHVQSLIRMSDPAGRISQTDMNTCLGRLSVTERPAFAAAANWFTASMQSIFLQDANSLIIKPEDLIRILRHLTTCFPWVRRITSYARSHTIAKISDDFLNAFRMAGLNRIHIGLESGSDEVLKRVKKGVDKKTHILAGRKVKNAGIELSEYVMPGLGGKTLSRIHALETADALNQINPDFIRLRTLAIPDHVELHEEYALGRFEKLTDVETAEELLLFLETLDGIASAVQSDHILNLFQEVEGKLPEDKDRIIGVVRQFLGLAPRWRMLYQVGRRLGLFFRLSDMSNSQQVDRVDEICRRNGITPDNVDDMIFDLMKRFI
ncbi:MAG: radical SAM protein [Desulfobacteraceae bacterium]|nr:radical SAM protein [Desulfobacteraceae bacterium]